jgi:hypothetical protein
MLTVLSATRFISLSAERGRGGGILVGRMACTKSSGSPGEAVSESEACWYCCHTVECRAVWIKSTSSHSDSGK